jgi:hypothetical protein
VGGKKVLKPALRLLTWRRLKNEEVLEKQLLTKRSETECIPTWETGEK